jgi:hypothetical protein
MEPECLSLLFLDGAWGKMRGAEKEWAMVGPMHMVSLGSMVDKKLCFSTASEALV